MEWINVSDKLPELNQRILVFEQYGGIGIATFDKKDAYGRELKDPIFIDEQDEQPTQLIPTHWMPLPNQPI